jgi:folate-binding protein YgfZ
MERMHDSLTPTYTVNGVAVLSHLGVIRVEGEDAAKFIHGQLTQDFSLLGQDTARLAAFCSAKGRVLASFVGFKRPQGDILLVCSLDLLAPTLKRLNLFVMRAKARLSDASDQFRLFGLAGVATNKIAGGTDETWAKADFGSQSVVNLNPADGTPRQLLVQPATEPLPAGDPLALDAWLWSEVRSGIPTVSAAVLELFVPQMLNFESVGGVSFKKGCYPGQEVVARSQFRGTLKRRTALVHCGDALLAGDAVFSAMDAEQPVGTVVQAAQSPSGGFDALVSVQIVAQSGTLHWKTATGPVLDLMQLPYALLEDV